MLKSKGIIRVEEQSSRIVVEILHDIIDYYAWFIKKKYWIRLQKPLHDAHITLVSPKIHKEIDWKKAKTYDKKQIEFEYDPNIVQGGYTKGFIMFYLKIYSEELDKLKEDIKVIEKDGYKGLHITIGSSGKSGSKHSLYWPEMITIKNK
jgi:hypothetical protein